MLGISDEKELVVKLNKKQDLELWKILNLDPCSHFAIHVNSKIYSKIHDKKVLPKADLFIAQGNISTDFLNKKDYLLTECDFKKFNLTHIDYSGISVKKKNSKNYTITKISPVTFYSIFGNYELGCGISLFVDKNNDIELNKSLVFKGWNTNINNMIEFYKTYIPDVVNLKNDIDINQQKNIYKKIKLYAKNELKNIIDKDEEIKKFIFQGIGAFPEPYTVHYFYQDDILTRDCYIPFYVDTGSGRHKGTFTVVIKPF